MYRTREEREAMKEANKFSCQRDTWFRTGGFTSTLTVPVTPMGVLANKVRANLAKGREPEGTRTKVIEDGGLSTKRVLNKSNQFPRDNCGREGCVMC